MADKKSVYDIITDRIIEKLEQGEVPWRKPWQVFDDGMSHRNMVYKKPYRGMNAFLTNMSGFDSPFWLTYQQINKLGGTLIKGEKYTPICHFQFRKKEEIAAAKAEGKLIAPFFLRYYRHYNVEQTEGIEIPEIKKLELTEHERIKKCDDIIEAMPEKPTIKHQGNRACYSPSKDVIEMPQMGQFTGAEEYYSVLFHELIHSTGHEKRVGRKEIKDPKCFGSKSYSIEELVAECGAAFLCGHADIEQTTLDNSAAYIQGWLKRLQNDSKFVVQAAQRAQKAADFVLGEYKDYSKTEEVTEKKAA